MPPIRKQLLLFLHVWASIATFTSGQTETGKQGLNTGVKTCDEKRAEIKQIFLQTYQKSIPKAVISQLLPVFVHHMMSKDCQERVKPDFQSFNPSSSKDAGGPLGMLGNTGAIYTTSGTTRKRREAEASDVADDVNLVRSKRFVSGFGAAPGGTKKEVSESARMMNMLMMLSRFQRAQFTRDVASTNPRGSNYYGDRFNFGGLYGDQYVGRKRREANMEQEAAESEQESLSRVKRFMMTEPGYMPAGGMGMNRMADILSMMMGTARDPKTGKKIDFGGDAMKKMMRNSFLNTLPQSSRPPPGKEPGDFVKNMAPLWYFNRLQRNMIPRYRVVHDYVPPRTSGFVQKRNHDGTFGDKFPRFGRKKRATENSDNGNNNDVLTIGDLSIPLDFFKPNEETQKERVLPPQRPRYYPVYVPTYTPPPNTRPAANLYRHYSARKPMHTPGFQQMWLRYLAQRNYLQQRTNQIYPRTNQWVNNRPVNQRAYPAPQFRPQAYRPPPSYPAPQPSYPAPQPLRPPQQPRPQPRPLQPAPMFSRAPAHVAPQQPPPQQPPPQQPPPQQAPPSPFIHNHPPQPPQPPHQQPLQSPASALPKYPSSPLDPFIPNHPPPTLRSPAAPIHNYHQPMHHQQAHRRFRRSDNDNKDNKESSSSSSEPATNDFMFMFPSSPLSSPVSPLLAPPLASPMSPSMPMFSSLLWPRKSAVPPKMQIGYSPLGGAIYGDRVPWRTPLAPPPPAPAASFIPRAPLASIPAFPFRSAPPLVPGPNPYSANQMAPMPANFVFGSPAPRITPLASPLFNPPAAAPLNPAPLNPPVPAPFNPVPAPLNSPAAAPFNPAPAAAPLNRAPAPVNSAANMVPPALNPNRYFYNPNNMIIPPLRKQPPPQKPLTPMALPPQQSPLTPMALPPQQSPLTPMALPPQQSPLTPMALPPQQSPLTPMALPPQQSPLTPMALPPQQSPLTPMALPPQQSPLTPMALPPQQSPLTPMALPPQQSPLTPMALLPQQPPLTRMSLPPQQSPLTPMAQPPQQPPLTPMALPPQQAPLTPLAQPPQQPPLSPMAFPPQQAPLSPMAFPPRPQPPPQSSLPMPAPVPNGAYAPIPAYQSAPQPAAPSPAAVFPPLNPEFPPPPPVTAFPAAG